MVVVMAGIVDMVDKLASGEVENQGAAGRRANDRNYYVL